MKISYILSILFLSTFVLTSSAFTQEYKDEQLKPTDHGEEMKEDVMTYRVKSGDSLAILSKRFYDTQNNWKLIADANDLDKPYALDVGQELIIPETKIVAEKRVSKEVVGNITRFDVKTNSIEIEDESGETHKFRLNDKVRIKYGEKGKALSVETVN